MTAMSVAERITADYTARINSGALPPGTVLPTVEQLQAEYGKYGRDGTISAMPVRQALYALRLAGLVEYRSGIGNIVRSDIVAGQADSSAE